MTTTIKDIAKHLGISASTVARALNDHPHTNKKTKSRVLKAADELNYVRSIAAQAMRSGHNNSIGLLVPNLDSPFFSALASVLSKECNERRFSLMLSVTNDDPDLEERHVRTMVGAKAAGIVLIPTPHPLKATVDLLKHRPFVQMYRTSPDLQSDSVTFDDAHMTYDAANHLLDLGHQRIAYFGPSADASVGAQRLRGVRAAMAERGLDLPDEMIALSPDGAKDIREAFDRIHARLRPTAIISGSPATSLVLAHALDAAEVKVPETMSFVGFGDVDWARYWRSGLTTIQVPTRKVTTASSELLFRRIGLPEAPSGAEDFTCALYRGVLIVRNSTSAPADAA